MKFDLVEFQESRFLFHTVHQSQCVGDDSNIKRILQRWQVFFQKTCGSCFCRGCLCSYFSRDVVNFTKCDQYERRQRYIIVPGVRVSRLQKKYQKNTNDVNKCLLMSNSYCDSRTNNNNNVKCGVSITFESNLVFK